MKKLLLAVTLMLCASLVYAQKKGEATSTPPKPSTTATLKLYPTITKDYVNVYVTSNEPIDFTLTMLSDEKENVLEWNEYAKESYQKKVDITRLPVGQYTIHLKYVGEKVSKSFTIKR